MSAGMNLLNAAQEGAQTYNEIESERARSKFASTALDANARTLRIQAVDAIRRGDEAAGGLRRDGMKVRGAQRVALAGQGVAVDAGIGAALQAETSAITDSDIITTKTNAWREAWGLRAEAEDLERKARMDRIGSKNKRAQTLVSGGMRALKAAQGSPAASSGYARAGGKVVPVAPPDYYKGRIG